VDQVIVPVTVKDVGEGSSQTFAGRISHFWKTTSNRKSPPSGDVVPISMVVLIDNDLKSKDAKQVGDSLRAIVAGLSPNDEAWVCRFRPVLPPRPGFISDQDKLLTELKARISTRKPPPGLRVRPSIMDPRSMVTPQWGMRRTSREACEHQGPADQSVDDAVYAAVQFVEGSRPRTPEDYFS